MRRPDSALLLALALLATFVGYQARGDRSYAVPHAAPRTGAADATTLVSDGGTVSAESKGGDVARDLGEVRRRLRVGAAGTYIGELLAEHDSALARWPDRTLDPLRVWVQPWSPVPDWRPEFVRQARDAFTRWERVGIPVRFTFVPDSALADVHVTWIDRFDEPISGKTLWARDARWWIVDGNITIAVHHRRGEPLDASAVRAITLHEVGHLIGLDHTADTSNIMTPRVRVRDLSAADQATARLLYTLPPGAVK